MSAREINIADRIEQLKGQILDRWREEVRKDPVQAASVHHLDDQELKDHLPALTDRILKLLRGEQVTDLEADAASHGLHRRKTGIFCGRSPARVADFSPRSKSYGQGNCRSGSK